jgi:hypothetical protein
MVCFELLEAVLASRTFRLSAVTTFNELGTEFVRVVEAFNAACGFDEVTLMSSLLAGDEVPIPTLLPSSKITEGKTPPAPSDLVRKFRPTNPDPKAVGGFTLHEFTALVELVPNDEVPVGNGLKELSWKSVIGCPANSSES